MILLNKHRQLQCKRFYFFVFFALSRRDCDFLLVLPKNVFSYTVSPRYVVGLFRYPVNSQLQCLVIVAKDI